MVVCSAPMCRNTSGKGFVLMRFPSNPVLAKKWIDASGRFDWYPPKGARLCEAHFAREQWLIYRRRLRPNTVPRKFQTCLDIYKEKLTCQQLNNSKVKEEGSEPPFAAKTLKNEVLGGKVDCRPLPCCVCYGRGMQYDRKERCDCITQKYLQEQDPKRRIKILNYCVEANEMLRSQIDCLKALLQQS